MKKILQLLCLLFLLPSCHDDNEKIVKENNVLVDMNIYIQKGIIVAIPDVWLIATDKDGNILDNKHWQNEPTLELKGEVAAGEKVNVIVLFSQTDGSITNFSLSVYSNIEPGRTWQLGKLYNLPVALGTVTLNFKNVPSQPEIYGYHAGIISPAKSNPTIGWIGGSSFDGSKWQGGGTYTLYDQNKTFFSFMPASGAPAYFETDTLKAAFPPKSYSYKYDEVFTPFDNTIQLSNATYYSNVFIGGVKESVYYGQGCRVLPSSKITLGYNDGFDNYFVKFNATAGDYSFKWNVLAPTLETNKFDLPVPDISVPDDSFSNFISTVQFTSTWAKNFEKRESHWKTDWVGDTQNYLNVSVLSDKLTGSKIFKNGLPQEILTVYPDLNDKLNSLTYSDSEFTFNEDGKTYAEGVEKIFSEDQSVVWRSSYSILKTGK